MSKNRPDRNFIAVEIYVQSLAQIKATGIETKDSLQAALRNTARGALWAADAFLEELDKYDADRQGQG